MNFLAVFQVLLLTFSSIACDNLIGFFTTTGYHCASASKCSNGNCGNFLITNPKNDEKDIVISITSTDLNCETQDFFIYNYEKSFTQFCSKDSNNRIMYINTNYALLSLRSLHNSGFQVCFGLSYMDREKNFTSTTLNNFNTTSISNNSTESGTQIDVSNSPCGRSYERPIENFRTYGDIEAVPNSWPWTVLLAQGGRSCVGTLINNNWVLAAADCLDGMNPDYLIVYFGLHGLTSISNMIIRTISKMIYHQNFNTRKNYWENNIVLLKLSTPVEYTNTIMPICLSANDTNYAVINSESLIIGWGLSSSGNPYRRTLRQGPIEVLEQNNCDVNTPTAVCARANTVDLRYGGCPIITKSKGLYYLSAVQSMDINENYDFDIKRQNRVYTVIQRYVNWIINTMKNNS